MAVTMFILYLAAILLAAVEGQYNESTLVLVHAFFRHGSRTPEIQDTYPNDPYKLENFLPMGYGQLTNSGKQRAYKLGKMFRKRYDDFLGDTYIPEHVSATSTDFDRTKMTALLVLAGLYPPAPVQQWDDEVNWIPIPYNYDKSEQDFFLRRPNEYCPTYMRELERVLSSTEVQKILKENRKVFQYVTKHAGKSVSKLSDMFRIYQTLNAEDYMGFTLPKWTESVYPETIHHLAAMQCEFENHNDILKKLNGGRMLKQVIEHMKRKVNGTLLPPQKKLYLYSGHENNVINILAALNLFKPHVPKYSAGVVIELHYLPDVNTHAVKVFYFKNVHSEPEEQILPECGSLCTLDTFIQVTAPHVPGNYTEECNSKIPLG